MFDLKFADAENTVVQIAHGTRAPLESLHEALAALAQREISLSTRGCFAPDFCKKGAECIEPGSLKKMAAALHSGRARALWVNGKWRRNRATGSYFRSQYLLITQRPKREAAPVKSSSTPAPKSPFDI